ncbi:uncharacterized protein [Montipora capricornis]|uniref:uncharacterized protein n=1 Tax=Montipora capricornis TaxID=246305 RepID=UPI0035F20D34
MAQISLRKPQTKRRKPSQQQPESSKKAATWMPFVILSDTLTFKVEAKFLNDQELRQLSKPKILSLVARIYDPIGLVAPFLIRAKIGLQEMWKRGVTWDEELPPDVLDKWSILFREMERPNGINFDRCYTPADATGAPTLCIFADASGDTFGTCAYARWQLRSGEFDVRLVAAKSRVAPIKSLIMPRRELQGAVLASRLLKAIKEETRLNFEQKVFS